MIIVITHLEKSPRDGRDTVVVSHGIDVLTDTTVTLPFVHPELIGAKFNAVVGEYTIDGDQKETTE